MDRQVTEQQYGASSPHVQPDENGRYPVCPSCRSSIAEVREEMPYPDGDGETWVGYACGSWRPDSDPGGDYEGEACKLIASLRVDRDRLRAALRALVRGMAEVAPAQRDAVYVLARIAAEEEEAKADV